MPITRASARVRRITQEEVAALKPGDAVYAADYTLIAPGPNFQPSVVAPGTVAAAPEYLPGGVADGGDILILVETEGGRRIAWSFNEVYVEDPEGMAVSVLGYVGLSALCRIYIPNLNRPEVAERVTRALQAEFGPDAELVNTLELDAVRDTRWDLHKVKTGRDEGTGRWVELEHHVMAEDVREDIAFYSGELDGGWQRHAHLRGRDGEAQ